MPQPKSASKERYERQRKGRELRRSLAAITPSNSHPQLQSPLFATLPPELRFSIFQLVLCQQRDHSRPIEFHATRPLHRPGHMHYNIVDVRLLLTCRLVYYEARAIPLRSTTHHFRSHGGQSWANNGDLWFHHVTKQSGAELYHLHDNIMAPHHQDFSKFLLPHLLWRRITWTVPLFSQHQEINNIFQSLANVQLPASCQEVNLELDTGDLMRDGSRIQDLIQDCQRIALNRSDGTQLCIDPRYAIHYKWHGTGKARWAFSGTLTMRKMLYHTTRLCWRAKVPRREYMSYDRLDCLRLDDCEDVIQESFPI